MGSSGKLDKGCRERRREHFFLFLSSLVKILTCLTGLKKFKPEVNFESQHIHHFATQMTRPVILLGEVKLLSNNSSC